MKFSRRLRAIYQELTPGLPVVDVCCDHGHLGLQAFLSNHFPEVVFIDQVEHSMIELEAKFNRYFTSHESQIKVRFITSDAAKVKEPLSGNVVIAGIGGNTMMKILEGLFQSADFKPNKLILCPNKQRENFEKSELFGLQHLQTSTVVELRIERSIFVFSA